MPARADLGWAEVLPAIMPAVGSCLAAGGAEAVSVSRAAAIGNDLAVVRVLKRDGARSDCVAIADGDRVLLTEPVPARSRQDGEGRPLFTPAGRTPPQGPCYSTQPAVNVKGWFSYDHCAVAEAAAPGAKAQHRRPAAPAG